MEKNSQARNINNEINCIVENVRNIEEQIKTFREMKPLFFQKQKIKQYNQRIEKLESIREFLYSSLQYKIDNI